MYCLVVPFYWYANSIILRSQVVSSLPTVAAVFFNCEIFFLEYKGGVPDTQPPPPPGHGPVLAQVKPLTILLARPLQSDLIKKLHVKKKKKKVKVRVYSLVSSAKRHSPDFIQLTPGHRTCSFISHLNFPGSIQPGCHFFGARNYSHSQAFTVLPGTHLLLGRESARVSKVPCLGTQRRSIFSAAGDQTGDLSLLSRARYPLSHDASCVDKHRISWLKNILTCSYRQLLCRLTTICVKSTFVNSIKLNYTTPRLGLFDLAVLVGSVPTLTRVLFQ